MVRDPFKGHPQSVVAQARRIMAITPSDSTALAVVPKAIKIMTSGNIKFRAVDGHIDANGDDDATNYTFAVTAGDLIDWVQIGQVFSTGTTATMIGLC